MAKKIAISLRKGGNGKTTTAVNLATALHKKGKKTFLEAKMKNITMKEKIIFIILFVLVSSVVKAAGVSMAFSKTLIVLTVLFLFYKFLVKKNENK